MSQLGFGRPLNMSICTRMVLPELTELPAPKADGRLKASLLKGEGKSGVRDESSDCTCEDVVGSGICISTPSKLGAIATRGAPSGVAKSKSCATASKRGI